MKRLLHPFYLALFLILLFLPIQFNAQAEKWLRVSTGPNSTSTRSLPSVVYRINPNSITFDPSKQMYAFVVYREDQPYVVHIEKGLHGYNQVKISRPLEDETQFERERFFDR